MHPAICCRAQSGESGHDMIAVSPWMWHFEWLMLLQEWVMSGESEGGTDEFIAITNQSPGGDRKSTIGSLKVATYWPIIFLLIPHLSAFSCQIGNK